MPEQYFTITVRDVLIKFAVDADGVLEGEPQLADRAEAIAQLEQAVRGMADQIEQDVYDNGGAV